MSEHADSSAPGQHTVSYRTVDAVVAVLFLVIAAIVMWDSARVGAAWASDGPEAGYFPFYVGLLMAIASLGTLVMTLVSKTPNLATFVGKDEFKSVLSVLIPTLVYVAVMPWLGLYVSSAIFIAAFMVWLGKYPLWLAAAVGVGVPLYLFMMFEVWFLIPLPKGPIEAALGF